MSQAAQELGTGAAAGVAGKFIASAPPVAVTGITLAGYPLNEWVYVATLIWLAMQIGGWLWDRLYVRRKEASKMLDALRHKQ